MVVKVYVSLLSGNMKLKAEQSKILSILQSRKIEFEEVDISSPNNENEKIFMREHSKTKKEGTFPLPPQIFNDQEYLGDFEAFEESVEIDALFEFLKMAPSKEVSESEVNVTSTETEESPQNETSTVHLTMISHENGDVVTKATEEDQSDDRTADQSFEEQTNQNDETEDQVPEKEPESD
ncbi:unnamed protein product [Owenia fusiformis]|uniref:SH3 domain-binding glutamic acid-rich protein n=1 Tax=Owenia fusiformis TaxID=6347 RepID=A0A8S4Q071_OWEFU|nr:unnamed protein product [Owenia fusiformis]